METEIKQLLVQLKQDINARFDEVNKRFDVIDKRFDTLERMTASSFNSLEERLSRIEEEIGLEPAFQY